MIGPLLNSFLKSSKSITRLESSISFSKDVFGNGIVNATVDRNMTNKQLIEKYGTWNFNNLTILEGCTLYPHGSYGGWHGHLALPSTYHPMYIKCSGTLTVYGSITSKQAGSIANRYDDAQIRSENRFRLGFDATGTYGFSVASNNYIRMFNYGASHTFFDYDFFLVGGAGGGCHRYTRGKWGHHHNDHSLNYGINYGGGWTRNHNVQGGCGGGFLALYYKDLIINGREYGVDPLCDISKISSNGMSALTDSGDKAGGCMVISARKIILGPNGTINSDAEGAGLGKLCYLNNVPQLGIGGEAGATQTGLVCTGSRSYIMGTGSSTYWYNTGVAGADFRKAYGNTSNLHGGAGLCFGYKVKEL